ncbi:unnamed protein product [Mytilus coruscus]|uniref:Uncharacterized protein n=1 Tax=Mytilus coruscus TaxID=42192 RepID=A0A6J8CX56_MYTCO|nr:unnamed protein product [Mytilus coruscus]
MESIRFSRNEILLLLRSYIAHPGDYDSIVESKRMRKMYLVCIVLVMFNFSILSYGLTQHSVLELFPEFHDLENKYKVSVNEIRSLQNDVARLRSLQNDVARLRSLQNDVARLRSLQNDVAQLRLLKNDVDRLRNDNSRSHTEMEKNVLKLLDLVKILHRDIF